MVVVVVSLLLISGHQSVCTIIYSVLCKDLLSLATGVLYVSSVVFVSPCVKAGKSFVYQRSLCGISGAARPLLPVMMKRGILYVTYISFVFFLFSTDEWDIIWQEWERMLL